MVHSSQGSDSSASSAPTSVGDDEKDSNIIVDQYLAKYVKKQSDAIKKLNKDVAKIGKERDSLVKETQTSSLQIYEEAIQAAEDYFTQNKETASDICKDVVKNLSENCDAVLNGLNSQSDMIDPDDAEAEADRLAKRNADEIRKRNNWRRQLVKDNHGELQQHVASVQKAINAEEVLKALKTIMNANTVH